MTIYGRKLVKTSARVLRKPSSYGSNHGKDCNVRKLVTEEEKLKEQICSTYGRPMTLRLLISPEVLKESLMAPGLPEFKRESTSHWMIDGA
ncbi:hypothetical protein CEXT_710081 [Caerostris extrusa]|uniref:Uncharacterized protein n=1 Tax=Caerostris extrusa TaxID=172846 RepID=A0AAV4VWU3_CAEEX|nr:hypothetical protein CEXT_710081 [Caerostris extrusa]